MLPSGCEKFAPRVRQRCRFPADPDYKSQLRLIEEVELIFRLVAEHLACRYSRPCIERRRAKTCVSKTLKF